MQLSTGEIASGSRRIYGLKFEGRCTFKQALRRGGRHLRTAGQHDQPEMRLLAQRP